MGGARLYLHRLRLLAEAGADRPGQERIWRAGTEVALAFTLVVFLYAYLNLNRWHGILSAFTALWLVGLGALGVLAAFDPPMAAGIARMSMTATAGFGLC